MFHSTISPVRRAGELLQRGIRNPSASRRSSPSLPQQLQLMSDSSRKSPLSKKIIIGGPAARSSVLDLVEKSPELAKEITLVSAPSWVKFIHQDWYGQKWGQSSRYLPPDMRKIAAQLYPNHPEHELMTFGMMQEILEIQRTRILDSKILLIEDTVDSIEETENGLITFGGNKSQTLATPDMNFHILHAGLSPTGPAEIAVNHFGNAYSIAKSNDPDPVVVIGGGLSLTWACRDLKDTPIIHVIPPGDRSRPDLKHSLHASILLAESDIQEMPDGTLLFKGTDVFDSSKQIQIRVQKTQVYSAMGSTLNRDLIFADSSKVTYLDLATSPRSSIQTFFSHKNPEGQRKITGLGKTTVPPGSLLANYYRLQEALGTYSLGDTNAVLLITAWEETVNKKLQAAGISVNSAFFSTIEDRTVHIFEKSIPSQEHIWIVIKNAFNKGVFDELSEKIKPMATDKEGKAVDWALFKEIIMQPTEEIMETARNETCKDMRSNLFSL